ncbi:hypothetical protein C6560_09820 [Enterobacter sp. FS01]|nr:hypothetical protein C6560_09820 [Enterobacter sp. FS01]
MGILKPGLLLTAFVLTACGGGGGGGGGGSDSTPPVTTAPVQTDNGNPAPTPETPAAAPASLTTGGTISGWTYTTPEGREYVMRGTGISAGLTQTQRLTRDDRSPVSSTSWCCGRMSYTTFGTWTQYEKGQHEVFYTGDATLAANVPTQGTATYVGYGMRENILSDASFNIDFAAKTINGTIAGNEVFGSEVAMQGNIANGGFTGSAQSGEQAGTFTGHFNGPTAEELGGLAQFADTTKNASFGATRQ